MVRDIIVGENRMVLTYQIDGWPKAIVTGRITEDNGFALEHIVGFNNRCLLRFLRGALDIAKQRKIDYVSFYIPSNSPDARQLNHLAHRMGFHTFDTCDLDRDSYIRMSPWEDL